jgi:hypothetical protein
VDQQKHDIIGLLKTKIASSYMDIVEVGLGLHNWKFISNVSPTNHCRILVGWNPQKLHLERTHKTQQWITCDTTFLNNNNFLRITFIYGHNTLAEREVMWNYISLQNP